jgi:diguanylate cyclase (GGDEF)-like protein
VKNKRAFDDFTKYHDAKIADGSEDPFAVAVCDVNGLKHVNDTQGHKAGDEYIKSACRLICETFQHSPVFRIGGDEFIVILKNDDYEQRHKLIERANLKFFETENDNAREPWERYSVAIGMAEYREGETTDAVFKRADQAMYLNKQKMKKNRT